MVSVAEGELSPAVLPQLEQVMAPMGSHGFISPNLMVFWNSPHLRSHLFVQVGLWVVGPATIQHKAIFNWNRVCRTKRVVDVYLGEMRLVLTDMVIQHKDVQCMPRDERCLWQYCPAEAKFC